jgi:S-adenosylmethionine hydrolase
MNSMSNVFHRRDILAVRGSDISKRMAETDIVTWMAGNNVFHRGARRDVLAMRGSDISERSISADVLIHREKLGMFQLYLWQEINAKWTFWAN